ncbi:MAG: hypothetical protein V4615_10790 [Bacteroidota bacterium]
MLKNLKLLLATFFILFILAEVVLRLFVHIYPGEKYSSDYFIDVDSLQLKHGFDADSNGIMKIEALTAAAISERIQVYQQTGKITAIADTESIEVYDLADHIIRMQNPDFKGDLKSYITRPQFPATDLDSAIQHYLRHPINEYGFRSIPFRTYNSGKKKVLLLGDSFTWGHSASNMFLSFADNLLAKGYAVYNTGITCTDPVQYHQVAEQYVPMLKPDVVIMNVYLINDIQYYSRKPIPFAPQMRPSNAGNLQTDFNGITVVDPDSVYNIIEDNTKIPSADSWFNKICSYTSTGTLLWRVCAKLEWVNRTGKKYLSVWNEAKKIEKDKPDVNDRVRMVQKICDEQGAKLLVCVIPYWNQFSTLTGPSAFKGLFDNIPYHLSPVPLSGYQQRYDGHFNDEGHKTYAEFLDSLIQH